jgi:D-amino-acid oxidase
MDTSRRLLLAGIGAGLVLPGCSLLAPHRSRFSLARGTIAPELVSRVRVGLRPFRAPGFVLRAEEFGDKRLIHNYGHGGGGITLSWGCAELAADLGLRAGERHAVVGCGVIGLTTATVLQRRGAAVTIYAKSLPPDTTSNIAGGHWSPVSVFNAGEEAPGFLAQFQRAMRIAHHRFQEMSGARYGVSWRRNFVLTERAIPPRPFLETIRDVMPGLEFLEPGEHPFGNMYVQTYISMMIEPNILLPALMDQFRLAGGRIEVRDFADRGAIAALPERNIFNCTGLGARALFDDAALEPVRGQLVVLTPQPQLDYNLFLSGGYYMFPRTDGILLGGTFDHGDWSTEPDAATSARIIEGNARAMSMLVA